MQSDAPRLPAWQVERRGETWLALGDDPSDGTGEWVACVASHAVTTGDMA